MNRYSLTQRLNSAQSALEVSAATGRVLQQPFGEDVIALQLLEEHPQLEVIFNCDDPENGR